VQSSKLDWLCKSSSQPFFAEDVLVVVGMFEVTMVTGSASVGVTNAYQLGPWENVR
jgi:hypothetical protein